MGIGVDEDLYIITTCLARQTIPFFLISSGFFYSKKILSTDNIKECTIKSVRPLLLCYVMWTIIWLPNTVAVYLSVYEGKSILFIIAVILRRAVIAGLIPYWYLLVLVESFILLSVVVAHPKFNFFGWVLCVFGLFMHVTENLELSIPIISRLTELIEQVLCWNCNFIMFGFPMVFLGHQIQKNEKEICTYIKGKGILLPAIYLFSVILAFILYPQLRTKLNNTLCTVQGILLFLVCISFDPSRISNRVCVHARDLSTVLFLGHALFVVLFDTYIL